MGYVTQSRKLETPEFVCYANSATASSKVNGFDVGWQPSQTTTSYRSGTGLDGQVEEDEDAALFTGGVAGATIGKIRSSDRHRPQSTFDNGHTFDTVTKRLKGAHRISYTNPTTKATYDGVITPNSPDLGGSGYVDVPVFDPVFYGTKAINITKPTNPSTELALTLAELKKEGFPRLSALKRRSYEADGLSKTISGDYLAYNFGLAPLGSEIASLANTVLESKRILAQYRRDSGRVVRRQMDFDPITTTTTRTKTAVRLRVWPGNVGGIAPFEGTTGNLSKYGTLIESIRTVRRIWFSGAYTYYLPIDDSVMSRIDRFTKQADRLLGLKVTPEVLWNLAPWSWLSDWNVNIGDILSNANAFSADGLVLRYGYLMCQTDTFRQQTVYGCPLKDGGDQPVTLTFHTTRKERFRAQPYGFATSPSSYTAKQWSILAALGISRGPRLLP